MGRRPGSPKTHFGCLLIFLVPFFLAGGGMLYSGVRDILIAGFGNAGEEQLVKFIVGGAFLGVSILFLFLGMPKSKTRTIGIEGAGGDDWQFNPIFPKLKRARPGENGVRLAPDMGPLGATIGLGIMALFWNGISYTILIIAIRENTDWTKYLIIAFLSIFLIIGLLIIYGFFHSLFTVLLVGKTPVDISREPLRLGEPFRLNVYQPGNFRINSVQVRMICKESATYQQGTSTRTDHHEVHEEIIGACGETHARRDGPILTCEAVVPPDAMHSFHLPHNKVRWMIEVKIDIPNRPDVKQEYEFRVVPEFFR